MRAQGQPMDGDRVRVGGDRALGHHHAAREAGAAGRILDVAGLIGPERLHRRQRGRPAADVGRSGDALTSVPSAASASVAEEIVGSHRQRAPAAASMPRRRST